jgi:hypothetical protein
LLDMAGGVEVRRQHEGADCAAYWNSLSLGRRSQADARRL